MTRSRLRSERGTTLIEIMLSLVIVLIGMLALFKILGSSIHGSATASRMGQAQARARWIMESIRTAPSDVLTCLTSTPSASWSNCETQCRTDLPQSSLDTCVYTTATMAQVTAPALLAAWVGKGQTLDRNGQAYALITGNASFVRIAGVNGRVNDIQVTVGWNDDGTATQNPDHTMVFRTAVFQ